MPGAQDYKGEKDRDRESASMPCRSHIGPSEPTIEVTLVYSSVALEVTQVYFFAFYTLND